MRVLAFVQGIYFLVTGLWPLFSIRTFLRVTGPKTDLWLVKTVGVLVSGIGAVLIVCSLRNAISLEIFLLALSSSSGLAGIDLAYVQKKIIAPIYLLDAGIEILFILSWLFFFF